MKLSVVVVLAIGMSGCAAGHCRSQYIDSSREIASEESLRTEIESRDPASKRIKVYKPDGSKSCNQGNVVPLKTMEKQLSGVRVFSREKGVDGLMHTQACGSDTGHVNIYEINEADGPKAQKLGFILLK